MIFLGFLKKFSRGDRFGCFIDVALADGAIFTLYFSLILLSNLIVGTVMYITFGYSDRCLIFTDLVRVRSIFGILIARWEN
jgi:hypothetical protein